MDNFCVDVRSTDLVVVLFGIDWLLLCPVMLPSSSSIVLFKLLTAPCGISRIGSRKEIRINVYSKRKVTVMM